MSQKDKSPESSPQNQAQLSMEDALSRIYEKSEELDVLQRKQTILACIGVVLILAILLLFFWNMTELGKSFDRQKLAERTIEFASNELVQNPDLLAMKDDLREVFVPALQKELSAKLDKSMPRIKSTFEAEKKKLSDHLQTTTRDRVMARLQKSFEGLEKCLITKHSKKCSEMDLELAVHRVQVSLLTESEKQLNQRLDEAFNALESLNDTCQSFKELPEYKEYINMERQDLEAQTVESFLELWIYHIDPARGNLPAAQRGGI